MAEDTPALAAVREEIVEFYGDQILAVQAADATIYVPVRPLCEALGLAWSGQFERLKRDALLAPELAVVRVTRTTATGGVPDMVCLPLKLLPGWLFGVQISRVRASLREKILRYQRDCYEVLWQAFRADARADAAGAAPRTGAEVAVDHARAILRLAEQHLEFERRLDQVGNKQEVMAGYMRGFVRTTQDRLHALEGYLPALPEPTITEDQAAEITLAVKHVAGALAAREGGNQYGRVYDALYRRYAVTVYQHLRPHQYEPCRAWLKQWFDEASAGSDGPGGSP